MRVFQTFETAFALQRGALFPWAPVMLACGIGLYFSLTFELTHPTYTALFVIFIMASGLALRGGLLVQVCAGAVALIVLGVLLAGLRAHAVAGPVLGFRYYGPVEGRIIAMDRSGSDALRLLLDQVVLADTAPQKVPRRVRVSLHGPQGFVALAPGQRVMMNAHLAAPAGPVEPGGFDFRRHAWFLGIGAVGYTRTPVVLAVAGREGVWLGQLRHRLSQRVQARIPGDAGGFAAAILTGDRSAVAQPRLEALRDSNLAHLLAISGLHMGLLAGFVFATIRGGLALCPPLALRLPARKIAAVFAMAAGAFYLALSGGNVATERAFSMVAVMLCAVLLDRRALSLRSVAVAALVVLALRPEALAGPGFQMSFAATTALVVVFGWLSQHRPNSGWMAQKWLRLALGVLVSSGIAGLATAPLGAAHFNQIAHYGLLANLAAVPLMGALIMPAAVIGICLMPFGLDGVPLWVMGQGLAWVLFVADTVAAWPGATSGVPTPPPAVLPMMALGALWAVLWRGRWAVLGARRW
ncbi:MAG: ComEC/Rec2 family competence protein [Lutimaribacter sp.]